MSDWILSEIPMTWARCLTLAVALAPSLTRAGTVRYELPALLGEHRFTGAVFPDRIETINTPYGLYAVEQARLVLAGSVQPGRARGDGVIRQATEFELQPFIRPEASFKHTFEFGTEPTGSSFSFDELYPYPFVPAITPLPSIEGYPPVTFSVGLWFYTHFTTMWPPKFDPPPVLDLDLWQGIIVDEPMIANVTTAYVELSGPSIVPEPAAGAMLLAGCIGLDRRRRRGTLADGVAALPSARD